MTTPNQVRCRHCAYLIEDDDGNWVCDGCGKNIEDIPDEDCELEQDY